MKRPLAVAIFTMGVVHLIVINDDYDDDGNDDYDDDDDDDHRGELDGLDPLQVDPSEDEVELFVVKDCDPPSLQILVVGCRPEICP